MIAFQKSLVSTKQKQEEKKAYLAFQKKESIEVSTEINAMVFGTVWKIQN